jgi:hypothetical protein
MTESLELKAALERAERAERREEQFRGWWAGVSKQLRDLQYQYQQEDWARAENCDVHGQKIKELDDELLILKRQYRETEAIRVKLVAGLHVLLDIVDAHRRGETRDGLTVDALIGAVGRHVRRTLDRKVPEPGKRSPTTAPVASAVPAEPETLFEVGQPDGLVVPNAAPNPGGAS